MAQGLHLSQKMALQQVLAPQLQQSLALLQAPMLELKALVEQELQQNPVLEETAPAEASAEDKRGQDPGLDADASDPAEPPADVKFDPATERGNQAADDFNAEFERLSQMDQEWRDYAAQTNMPMRPRAEEEERRQYLFDSLVATTSLQEHLLEQVRLSDLPEDRQPVAEIIIGNIDDQGYLRASVDELAFSTNTAADRILQVLDVVQTFHPPGIGARDLRECLLLQLQRAGRQDTLEYRIVDHQMEALGKRRFPDIARALGCPVEEVQQASERISQLEPRPGRDFLPDGNLYVVPEVFVCPGEDDEAGPPTFLPDDLTQPRAFAEKLRRQIDPCSKWLWEAMSPALRAQSLAYAETGHGDEEAKRQLVAFLNRMIGGKAIYQEACFAGVTLSHHSAELLKRHRQKEAAAWAFEEDEIQEVRSLVDKWMRRADPVSKWLWDSAASSLDRDRFQAVAEPGNGDKQAAKQVRRFLNQVIKGKSLWHEICRPEPLTPFALSAEADQLRRECADDQKASRKTIERLNRVMLEDT